MFTSVLRWTYGTLPKRARKAIRFAIPSVKSFARPAQEKAPKKDWLEEVDALSGVIFHNLWKL